MTALRLTLGWVAHAVTGTLRHGDPERELGAVVTDSRTVQPGDLFVALKGPRFDAHDFVDEVLGNGAAAIVEAAAAAGRGAGAAARPGPVIEVADTLRALQDLAHAVRREAGSRVIAITGSAGKTTTKETIAAMLETRFAVVKNKGNLNNHIGLPLSLLQLRERPDVAVMELGMNHAGEISTLVAIAEPDVRVWTNVGDAHLGFFASSAAIADAKAEILERASAQSLLVCNADDPLVLARVRGFTGRTLTFGVAPAADVRAADIDDRGIGGMRARLIARGYGERDIETPLLGRGNLANVLAAAAVALDAGIPLDEVASVAARLQPANRRGAVRRLRDDIVVIDDSYNSSPAALRRALEVVARGRSGEPSGPPSTQRSGRRIAVLGEMLELGDHARRLHAESGAAAAAARLDLLVTVGGEPARALAAAAVSAGMSAEAVAHFDTSAAAAEAVVRLVRPGDIVLVKGSRGVRTDVVVERLVAELA